jgi:biopolymer transport protein ExbD
MRHSIPGLATSGSDELIARRTEFEQPEFDITAMVDLVFMMNIYFLVTFITVSLGGIALPSAKHVSALDAESSVILTLVRTLDGKSVNLYLGDGEKGEAITDTSQQEKRVQEAVEQGVASGKSAVLLKAEKKVRLADLFRISTAATNINSGGEKKVTLHVAVLEAEKK